MAHSRLDTNCTKLPLLDRFQHVPERNDGPEEKDHHTSDHTRTSIRTI